MPKLEKGNSNTKHNSKISFESSKFNLESKLLFYHPLIHNSSIINAERNVLITKFFLYLLVIYSVVGASGKILYESRSKNKYLKFTVYKENIKLLMNRSNHNSAEQV
jgi:hypothetical protein